MKNYDVEGIGTMTVVLVAVVTMMSVIMIIDIPHEETLQERVIKCQVNIENHQYNGSYIYDIDTCDKIK